MVKDIVAQLIQDIEGLRKTKNELTKEIDEKIAFLEATLKYYTHKIDNSPRGEIVGDQKPEYKTKKQMLGTLKSTVIHIINNELKGFEKSDVIFEMLLEYVTKTTDAEKEAFRSQVSNILSKLKKEGLVCTYQLSGSKKDTLWGKKAWLGQNGKPIDLYLLESTPSVF